MLGWVAATSTVDIGTAIMQMPARTPAATASTAATLDLLSEGRVHLGLGVSGPQVVEGWHGQPWGKPLTRTREYVSIVRTILRREAPLEHHGEEYEIPYAGADATGLGKPLKLILKPRPEIPILLAALGPKGVALAAEIADGWLPIFFSPARFDEIFRPSLEEGFARAGSGKGFDSFDLAALAAVVVGENLEECRNAVKPLLALYIGGMGARGNNFYARLAGQYGFEGEAARIQELFLAGNRAEAVGAVPDALVDEIALVGPRERIAERIEAYRACGVTTLIAQTQRPEALRMLAELVL